MKGFSATTDEPIGRMINRVRDVISGVQVGESVDRLLELLGEPDQKANGYVGGLSPLAREQIASGSLGEIPKSMIQPEFQTTDETWVYTNPFRATISHHFAIASGKIVRIWERRVP
jgi:hypothetical protein